MHTHGDSSDKISLYYFLKGTISVFIFLGGYLRNIFDIFDWVLIVYLFISLLVYTVDRCGNHFKHFELTKIQLLSNCCPSK